jgi:hypothetical protein
MFVFFLAQNKGNARLAFHGQKHHPATADETQDE